MFSMRQRSVWVFVSVFLSSIAVSCGDDDGSVTENEASGTDTEESQSTDSEGDTSVSGEDTKAPSIEITGLEAYAVISGNVEITSAASDDVGVETVELLVNDALVETNSVSPFTFSFDSTKAVDGPLSLTLKAFDAAGNEAVSQPLRVVVVNDGVEVTELEEGPTGTMTIPADFDGSQETHLKHHWTPAAPYTKVLCVGLWENPIGGTPWEMKAEMGTGTCPHSGAPFEGSAVSDTGALEFFVTPAQGVAKGERHFCHIGAENAMEHKGEDIELTFKVFLFGEKVDMDDCPLNSGYPCRCDGVKNCDDGSECVGLRPDQNGGLCAAPCEGAEDEASCAETKGYGLYGECAGYKGASASPEFCIVICEEDGQTAECPPDFECENEICMPTY